MNIKSRASVQFDVGLVSVKLPISMFTSVAPWLQVLPSNTRCWSDAVVTSSLCRRGRATIAVPAGPVSPVLPGVPGSPCTPCSPFAPCSPCGPASPLGPGSPFSLERSAASKSAAPSDPSLTLEPVTELAFSCAEPTLLRGSFTAAYDVPPSAMNSARSARWFRRRYIPTRFKGHLPSDEPTLIRVHTAQEKQTQRA